MIAAASNRFLPWAVWLLLVVCTIAGLIRYTLRADLPLIVEGSAGFEFIEPGELVPETEGVLPVTIDGLGISGGWHVRLALAGRRVGESVTIGLVRKGDTAATEIVEHQVALVTGYTVRGLITLILVCVTTLGLAAFLLGHRLRHPAALPLAAMLSFLGATLALEEWGAPLGPGLWKWLPGVFWAYTYVLVPPAMLSFASFFPLESTFWRPLGWLRRSAWIFAAILGTSIASGIVLYVGAGVAIGYQLDLYCQYVLWAFMGASVLLVGTGLFITYRRSSDWATRNRIRWVLMGTLIGGLLPLLLIILPRALEVEAPMEEHLALLFLLFLPLSLVISVVRHNLLDISVVLRQGVMYAPATVVVYFLFGGIFVVLGFISLNKLPGVDLLFTFRVVLILALPLLLFHLFYEPLRKRTQGIVDRFFFRTKYSYGRTVRAFNEELDRSLTGVAIINYLHSQVMQTVMSTWIQVVERDGRWHNLWENVENAGLIEKPLLTLPFHELEGLELWLGPKRSGMAYHTYDRALLETLVGMTSTALQREVMQRQLLEEAAEKERLEALTQLKDDFLSLVSHDLRSPLAAISMSASMMARRSQEAGDEKGSKDATRIERNTMRLTHMVERLLHTARVDAGRVEPKFESCRLTEVTAAAFDRHQMAAESEQVVLESTIPENSEVRADPLLLQEVLSNLVDNALKVSESGTVISIGAEQADRGWNITISDQGPGIPEDRIPTLFERGEVSGTMTRTIGFGLGLFLVHELVGLQRGRVELRHTSSEGTTFAIYLPGQ